MAEVITLAAMPKGRNNKFVFTEEHRKFYEENNHIFNYVEIGQFMGVSPTTVYKLIKEHKLSKKIKLNKHKIILSKPKYFCWDWAKQEDWIFRADKNKI
jgi:predicted DNA-binding transcriptional regulator AlpA